MISTRNHTTAFYRVQFLNPSHQSKNGLHELLNRSAVSLDHVVRCRLIFRRTVTQYFADFINERSGSRERWSLGITADACRDGFYGCCQPDELAISLQHPDVLWPKNRSTAGIDHELVTLGKIPTDVGLHIAEVLPSMPGYDFRNRLLGSLDDLCIGRDEFATQPCGKHLPDRAFAGTPITDQHNIHEKLDSRTAPAIAAAAITAKIDFNITAPCS